MTGPSRADTAKAALDRHAWREAYDLLADADARGELAPDELELLAQAAWWLGMLPTTIDARERAYAAAVKSNETEVAVTAAIMLGRDNLYRNALAVASGWLNRAERLLEGVEEGPGHGWLAATRSFHAALSGDTARTLELAEQAHAIARRIGDRDLEAMALSERGAALVAMGRVDEGLALVDEATVAAVGGELDAATAGGICCTTIESCAALGEWQRAAEWTEAQDRWCRREGISGYPGMCRLFRSEIKRLRGAWPEAEAEARRASEELQGFIPAAVGGALYQIGEIRLARGDLDAAEEALLRAHGIGSDPEPALSLLRLAQGRGTEAAASIRHALDETTTTPAWRSPPGSGLYRVPLLAAAVEIDLAGGDVAGARQAADELDALADQFGTLQIRATALTARGAVALAEGDPAAGAQTLRRALQAWLEFDAPFEAARVRLRLAVAYEAAGDRERATLEADSARTAFASMGATPGLRGAEGILARLGGGRRDADRSERRVRTFVFTDLVDSTRLAETIGDEAWRRLLRWHDETVRSIVAEQGGIEVKATGDGFLLTFEVPERAIDASIAIQRRLAEQRRDQGFAPSMRIGMHTAEASRTGLDYVGVGVNEAARVGAAAKADEILVTAETVAAARHAFDEVGRRRVELKGLSQPVEVVSIAWR